MDIAYIDYLANQRTGLLRTSNVVSKVLLCVSCMTICLTARLLWPPLGVIALLVVLNLSGGLKPVRLLWVIAYPVFFSLVFLFPRFLTAPAEGLLLLCKAVAAALSMILLVSTTPFTDLFGFLGLFLPKGPVSVLFFCYRIFFIIIDQLSDVLRSMQLRGPFRWRHCFFSLKSLAAALGGILIRALDMAERCSKVYAIRGYRGVIYSSNPITGFGARDLLPLGLSVVVIVGGILLY